MSDEATAVIGAGGALIGAAITAGVALLQQRKDAERERDRRAEDADLERRAAEEDAKDNAKVSARILLADLLQAELRLRQATEKNKYWSPRFALPTESWREHREVVARYMGLNSWSAVSLFFRSVGTLERQADGAREKTDQPRPEFNEWAHKQVALARERAEPAEKALREFSGDTEQLQETELADEPG